MNSVIRKGTNITKVLIWNRIENEAGYDVTECELTFNDGTSIHYECRDIDQIIQL